MWGQLNLPVNVEVKFALFFQQWEQLLLRLPDSHAFGKHRVHKELAGLQDPRNKMINILICQSLAKVIERRKRLPLIHSLVAGTPSPCIHPFSELYRGGSLSMENADKSMLCSPFQSPRKCSTEEGADLVVIREWWKCFVESDALKLLVVGVNPEHFELGGGDSHVRLQVLFKCCQRDPFVHINH